MRYLGIDYGSKRVGIAISDPDGQIAFPLTVLDNSKNLLNDIKEICRKNEIEEIVIGDSKDYKGHDNVIMKEIRTFIKELEKIPMKVNLHPEFLTSSEAEKIQGKNKMLDASAAAIILRSYLETIKK